MDHRLTSYWTRWKADPTRPLALLFSIVFAFIFSGRFFQTHAFIFLLLAFRFWMMSFFIANRFAPEKPVPPAHRAIAYASKGVPFFYHAPLLMPPGPLLFFGEAMAFVGALLSTWGVIDLGRRFGVSPAKRGHVCRSGAYRWMKHPIYTGYALVELDCVLQNPANIGIFILSMTSLLVRIYLENQVLQEV